MRITGACTTRRPELAQPRAPAPLAWARARVTATVRPLSGSGAPPGELLGELGHRARRR